MDLDFFEKHVPTFLLIVFLSISVLFLTAHLDRRVCSIKSFIFYLVMPTPQRLADVMEYGHYVGENLFSFLRAHNENIIFREKLNAYIRREHMFFRLMSENERLRELLQFKQIAPQNAVPAQIIGRDPIDWFKSFIIDKGTRDGVTPNASVIAVEGERSVLIGRILHAGEKSSKVLLLTDSLSSVAVTSRRSGSDGVVEGNNTTQLMFNYIVPQADIIVGDTIVTSGIGGVFTPGLLIGHVQSIIGDAKGYFKRAVVASAVDYNALREVMVIKEGP